MMMQQNQEDSVGGRETRASRLSFASFRLSDIESVTDADFLVRRVNDQNSEEEEPNVLNEKIWAAKFAKRLLFVIMLISAAIASSLTYHLSNQKRNEFFEDSFFTLGASIADEVDQAMDTIINTCHSLAISYRYTDPSWPNATLGEFLSRTSSFEYNAIAFLPYIQSESARRMWEQYAMENQEYVLSDPEGTTFPEFNNVSRLLAKRKVSSGQGGLPEMGSYDAEGTHNSTTRLLQSRPIEDGIFALEEGEPVDDTSSPPFWPIWQASPLDENSNKIMYNQYSNWFGKPAIALRALSTLQEPTLSQILFGESSFNEYNNDSLMTPRILLYYPVMDFAGTLVGAVNIDFELASLLGGSLPETSEDVLDVVISNSCGQAFSFRVDGPTVTFVGSGYSRSLLDSDLVVEKVWNQTRATCIFLMQIYPSDQLQEKHIGNKSLVYTSVVLCMFVFCCVVFGLYSCVVEQRQAQLLRSATQTSAIVQNLFPRNVRERMFREVQNRADTARVQPRHRSLLHVPYTPKIRLKNFLADNLQVESSSNDTVSPESISEPIADLFPHTTVMFADIAGFTAWSSEREPSQVFKLLESLYRKFDEVAHKLGVFKVETIGDCYVAVTGLPDPVADHAVLCARFAFEILFHMRELTKQLEGTLGPGTSDLALRIGLHSGAVTAGVLRGEKSRFQLFGDTMNTAARIESCGFPDRVQCSEYTAQLIKASGKDHWLTKRRDLVLAKGKGEMQTYWLKPRRYDPRSERCEIMDMGPAEEELKIKPLKDATNGSNGAPRMVRRLSANMSAASLSSIGGRIMVRRLSAAFGRWGSVALPFESTSDSRSQADMGRHAAKNTRLVNWNVDVLLPLLAKIVSSRRKSKKIFSTMEQSVNGTSNDSLNWSPYKVLDEVTEIISFPTFDPKATMADTSSQAFLVDEGVKAQLREYVAQVAALYRDNPFHNFEHASHVTMSANKLLKRIIHPDDLDYNLEGAKNKTAKLQSLMKELHMSTYGVSSDPLTQFSIVFSALIHDADHSGVPNVQLVEENTDVAVRFSNKSVAEQNSFFLAWELLMEPQYGALRSCIWSTKSEKQRFRQLVVNSVMATDIMDKDQQLIRKKRWDKAFMEPQDTSARSVTGDIDLNRKATAVLEHIIQASDVAHTMQHWRIYCKWNERYFREKFFAWMNGRADSDPSIGWFEGEIGFYDFYIIPLARKLKESGVFGVSSDEYLQYALENRQEWELKGRKVCEAMLDDAKDEWETMQEAAATAATTA